LNALVLDASTILGLVLKDEHSSSTAKLIEALEKRSAVYVPTHWWIEVVNGLLMAERRKRLSGEELPEAIDYIREFPMIVDDQTATRCEGDTLVLARRYKLTIYDTAYLELAMRRKSKLATIDKALARAAADAGVESLI